MAHKKKEKKNIPNGKVFIHASFNNTIITITDMNGNTIAWSSSGIVNFKGSRKSTPYAAQLASKDACMKAINIAGLNEVEIYVKGPGIGRESAIRSVAGSGLLVKLIKDVTPLPHNGCRPKKKRRV
jgi:small subunit ribosomal protein S11